MNLARSNIFGGVTILDSVVKSYEYAPHWHDEYVFAVYRGGAKQFRCARYFGTAASHDLLVIAPGTLHSARTFDDTGWDYRSLYFTLDQLSKATGLGENELDARFRDFTHVEGRSKLALALFCALDGGDKTELALSEWLLSIPANSDPISIRIPKRLADVHDRIMDDPVSPIQLGDLAKLAEITPEHLSRTFRKAYGVSPFQLVIAARIQLARSHIQQGTALAGAAHLAGFSDQSHMTRWFKRTYGVSPGHLFRDQ